MDDTSFRIACLAPGWMVCFEYGCPVRVAFLAQEVFSPFIGLLQAKSLVRFKQACSYVIIKYGCSVYETIDKVDESRAYDLTAAHREGVPLYHLDNH